MQFGQDLPRPDWVPVYPGGDIVQASRTLSEEHPQGFGRLEIATRASMEALRGFYLERLTASGFAMNDDGTGPMDARTADFLGVARILTGRRDGTGDRVFVQIRTPEGILLPSRVVELRWWKAGARFQGADPTH
jgi:hypothetical protein